MQECEEALVTCKHCLDTNSILNELLATYPALNGDKVLSDESHEELRQVLKSFRHTKKTMELQLETRARPGFQFMPQVLMMVERDASSVEGKRKMLARATGVIVHADRVAK